LWSVSRSQIVILPAKASEVVFVSGRAAHGAVGEPPHGASLRRRIERTRHGTVSEVSRRVTAVNEVGLERARACVRDSGENRRFASALMCADLWLAIARSDRPQGRKISLRSASLRCVLRGGYSRDSTEIGRPAGNGVESHQHTEEY
jgi:hypothetical protein